jgi:hypothetical protein
MLAPIHTCADLTEPVHTLLTSLEVIRLACKDRPEVVSALEAAGRETKVLCQLIERLRVPGNVIASPEPCYVAPPASSRLPSCALLAELPAVST